MTTLRITIRPNRHDDGASYLVVKSFVFDHTPILLNFLYYQYYYESLSTIACAKKMFLRLSDLLELFLRFYQKKQISNISFCDKIYSSVSHANAKVYFNLTKFRINDDDGLTKSGRKA